MTMRGPMFPPPQGTLRLPPQPRFAQQSQDFQRAGVVPNVDVGPRMVDGSLMPIQEAADAQFVVAIPGVTGWYPTPISSSMDAGASSSTLLIRFQEAGLVQYLVGDVIGPSEMATPITPDEARTLCGISVVDGVTLAQLMNGGNGEQPVSLSQLLIGGPAPMQRRVKQLDTWRITFTNFSGGNDGMRAQAMFGFLADARTIRK